MKNVQNGYRLFEATTPAYLAAITDLAAELGLRLNSIVIDPLIYPRLTPNMPLMPPYSPPNVYP